MSRSRRSALVRTVVAATAAVGSLLAAGCSSSPAHPSGTTLKAGAPLHSLLPKAIADKGTIDVASDIEYPPFESYAADNTTVQGIDRELADAFETQFGVKLVFHNTAFDAIIPGLVAGRYDMAMSAMSDTPTRQKQVDFVDYFKAGGGIMLAKGNPQNITTLDDLCGKKVAIDKGTTEEQDGQAQSTKCQSQGKQPLDIAIYPGQNQMVLALQSGRADAALLDSTAGSYVAKQTGQFTMLAPYQAGFFGIVFPKGATQLEQAFAKALAAISKDGTYRQILAKFGEDTGAIDSFTINGATS
ncbi:MAG: ABC transporter substrate-binding protein [Jatrophihabitans sp.]|nr:MAG: ABC transporter substrate-binding protein [Jatrophihabitans sp.]